VICNTIFYENMLQFDEHSHDDEHRADDDTLYTPTKDGVRDDGK
jgi:hypothetical protein